MIPFLTYLLKVTLCSGLLTGYYYIALRNRAFHQWNRFYLLATVALSLTLPLTTFTIFHDSEDKGAAIQLLRSMSTGEEYVVYVTKNAPFLSFEQGLTLSYATISLVLLATLVLSVVKILALIKKHSAQQVSDIHFINSEIRGTPFSFFHYIFWNPSIDLQSENGSRIFRHEMVHVRERHSLDKLAFQLMLALFWCNPFFWIIRYELRMIHEFIADRKALDQQDASALAAMILQAAYPTRYNQLLNSFFHQSIKRRIHMLAQKTSPRVSYISRILFIPLAACLVLAFSVRTKPSVNNQQLKQNETNTASSSKAAVGEPGLFSGQESPGQTVALKDTLPETNVNVLSGSFDGLVIVNGKEYKEDYKKIPYNTIHSVNVLKGAKATAKYGDRGKNGVIEISLRDSPKEFNGLVIVDGKEYKEDFKKIDPNIIQSVNVLKGDAATKKYGSKGTEGVIDITLKKVTTSTNDAGSNNTTASDSPTFTQTETPPQFTGGIPAWRSFLQQNLNASVPVENGAPLGAFTVMVQLLVEKDGTLSEIKPLTTHGFGMEEEVVRTLKLSPKWEPARQNGNAVRAYHKQPVTFVISSGDEKTEEPPTTLKSGMTLKISQLQSIPFNLLIKPNRGNYNSGNIELPMTNTMLSAAEYTISGVLTTNGKKGEIYREYFSDDQPTAKIKSLIKEAASGDIITIENIKGTTRDGREFKLPSLVYFIK